MIVIYFQMSEVHSLREGLIDIVTQEMLTQEQNTFTALTREKYISLTTFRKTGKAVVTPVWFAEQSGTIYVETAKNAGKIKRIHHTARITLAVCTLSGKVTGPTLEGKARLLTRAQEIVTAEAAVSKKYGLTRRIYYFFLMNALRIVRRNPTGELDYIAIEPAGN
jgi:PPOX class probable F420-dependent enzyme